MAFSTGGLLLAGSGFLVLAFLIKGTYYAFSDPLAKVPGPKLWAFTDLFWLYYVCRGVWPYKNKELHEEYGPVIIHNNLRTDSTNNYHKDMRVYRPSVSGHVHIINANDEHHRRHRRLLGFAFSEKALRGQEDLIQYYIYILIRKLAESASQYGQADLHQWINFVTFDLICELSFGESLGNLERGYRKRLIPLMGFSILRQSETDGLTAVLCGSSQLYRKEAGLSGDALDPRPPALEL
ncbi:cytochrome P450 [Rhypophila decipiens]|uniref:Cytochrome P450 n=1 Tax=Rhypophila decipiens TaxID=261697 RepID=A0AAN6Y3H9_9PEZI|nr:cytochrome P450 [Rhypophila decipiens]